MLRKRSAYTTAFALIAVLVLTAHADRRTQLKPGWNLFSPKQDVEMGIEVAKQAESQLPILNDPPERPHTSTGWESDSWRTPRTINPITSGDSKS